MSENENITPDPNEPAAAPAGGDSAVPENAAPVEGAAGTPPVPPALQPPVIEPVPPAAPEPVAAAPATPRAPTPPPTAPVKETGRPTPPSERPHPPVPPLAAGVPTHRTPPDGNWWWGTGRRKRAVARVRIRPGTGKFLVNKRDMEEFFNEERDRRDLLTVLEKTNTKGALDVHVNVRGGGFTGQAGAIILGLGRAIRRYDQSLEPILRDNGFLTRDPRKVERKKYGQPGARKRFQFSKR